MRHNRVQACTAGRVLGSSLYARTIVYSHILIFAPEITALVNHQLNNQNTEAIKKRNKIIQLILFGIICTISAAVMAIVLWINFKNRLK